MLFDKNSNMRLLCNVPLRSEYLFHFFIAAYQFSVNDFPEKRIPEKVTKEPKTMYQKDCLPSAQHTQTSSFLTNSDDT